MPPKPAPKLTKKQLKELADQQKKKKDQEQQQKRIQQELKKTQQKRLYEVQLERRAQQEKVTVAQEKEKYRPFLQHRLKQQQKQFDKLSFDQQWQNQTSQYFKSYDVNGVNLSTFINIFRDQPFQSAEGLLKFCEESQVITQRLKQKQLQARTQNNAIKEMQAKNAIIELNQIKMRKLEQIMIIMANSAQDMEEKNNQMAKTKNQPNVKKQGQKLLEYQHYLSKNFKIGMFLNSTTTKNNNKFRPIQIKQFGLNTQIPSKWINANTIVKFQWTNFNPYSPEVNETFNVIGGVYNIQFYQLLLGSKKINNIVLKRHYKGKQILQKFKLATSLIRQPFQLQYQLPSHLFLHTFDQYSLKFAQYDATSGKWTALPNDTVQQYDVKAKKVVCKVSRPEPIGYIQEKCFDYPYVSWQLRTVEQGKVHLDIELKRQMLVRQGAQKNMHFMLKFQIKRDLVRLHTNEHYPQLEDLCSEPRTPQALLSELSSRGIHLLPTDLDYIEAQLPAKQKQSQQRAVRQISYAVGSFYIRSQPNSGPSIVIKMRENLQNQSIFLQDQQKDWKIINWHNQRCWVSNKDIQQKHLNLEVLLQKHDFCLAECLQRIKYDKEYLLRRSVKKMLSLTRILSFTSADPQNSRLRDVLKKNILVIQ